MFVSLNNNFDERNSLAAGSVVREIAQLSRKGLVPSPSVLGALIECSALRIYASHTHSCVSHSLHTFELLNTVSFCHSCQYQIDV